VVGKNNLRCGRNGATGVSPVEASYPLMAEGKRSSGRI
jgi:hypothetical protein